MKKEHDSVVQCLELCKNCDSYLKCLLGACRYATYVDMREVDKRGKVKTLVTDCFLDSLDREWDK